MQRASHPRRGLRAERLHAIGPYLQNSGSACTSDSTGANRSPRSATRASTCVGLERELGGSPESSAARTSSHSSGVETVGRSPARSEYTQTVVLLARRSGSSRSAPCPCGAPWSCARRPARARPPRAARRPPWRTASCCSKVTSARLSGTYTCSPFEPGRLGEALQPEVLEHPVQLQRHAGSTRRCSPARRGRGRTRARSGARSPRRARAARAARSRRGSRATRASRRSSASV